jgi:hypothetical protein
VKSYDKLRDQVARRIEKLWRDEHDRLRKVKAETVCQIEKLRVAAAAEAGVPELGGEKGNLQFRSFDGAITVSLDRQYRTEFDERLRFAQQLILEAVAEIAANVENADIVEIARRAFQPRKSGNLDMQRIRDLRTYNVRHPKWKQACEIISECERVVAHRDYIRVAVRNAPDGKPEPIVLDIAAVEAGEGQGNGARLGDTGVLKGGAK